ncbi:MAG: hypothetical protein HY726_15700 [Candidatus Rokubacteria bacterium]|nr:hypothetical protein [Candidatus Rokubacteria bacterium]
MRRTTVTLVFTLALGILLAPLASDAQQARRPYRIGVLHESYLPNIPQLEGLKAHRR